MLAPTEFAADAPYESESAVSTGMVYAVRQQDDAYGMTAQALTNLATPTFFVGSTGFTGGRLSYPQVAFTQVALRGRPPVRAFVQSSLWPWDSQIIVLLNSHYHSYHGMGTYALTLEGIDLVPAAAAGSALGTYVASATRVLSNRARERFPVVDEVTRLRDMAGLDQVTLAEVFGVTRQAYHSWQNGTAPTAAKRRHLLEVLALIEDAARRLGDPHAVGTWLLTPITPGGRRPVDYLGTRDYDVVRGLLIRARPRPGLARPLPPAKRLRRELPPEVREAARRRLQWPRSPEDDQVDC